MSVPDWTTELFTVEDDEITQELARAIHTCSTTPPDVERHPEFGIARAFAMSLRRTGQDDHAYRFWKDRCVEMIDDLAGLN